MTTAEGAGGGTAPAGGWRLLHAVIDHLPSLVVVKDLEGRYLMVNEAFARFNGITPADALGRRAYEVMPAVDAEAVADADIAALESGETVTREDSATVNGETRHFIVSRFPLRDDDGQVFALGSVATDITERKRLDEQLLHQQKLEAVGRLAGGLAHGINNLLTAVRCNADLVLDGMSADDPDREHLDEIGRSVRGGAALTRQLLTFSRAHVVRPSQVDVNRVLGGMADMLRRFVGPAIELRLELAGDLWMVHADEGQLEQVLLNLLSNAQDAMRDGGTVVIRTANVTVQPPDVAPFLPAGEYVRLSVVDEGDGIDPQHVPLLFEPFFTTKASGGGTGLGLSTAFAIVQQARGTITVDTALGGGTTFHVHLPRHHDEQETGSAATAAATAEQSAAGAMLMVVDDEPAVRVSLRRLLERRGYRILEAGTPLDAIEQFERVPDVALVLTDVFMSAMSGPQLAEELRARRPGLPVVFMSGYPADEVVRRGLMSPTTSFLQKPFERAALLDMVESLLA